MSCLEKKEVAIVPHLSFFSVDVGISCSCWLSILIQQKIRKQAFPRMKSVYQKINMKSEQLKTEFNN